MQKLTKFLLITFVIILYFLDIYMYYSMFGREQIDINWVLVNILLALSIILIIANIIVGLLGLRNKRNEQEIFSDIKISLLTKILLIPFFILNLYLWFLFTMAFLIVPGLQIFMIITIMGIIWTYGILLATSCYSASAIISLYRKKKIKLSSTIIYGILQFIFVTDVISYLIFYIKHRRKENKNAI